MDVETIATPELGDRSYVVHADGIALVVDPQRDLDRVQAVLDAHGLSVSHVLETHRHNDYLTGGYALAQRTGAVYVVPGDEQVDIDRLAVHDGDELECGPLRVLVVATPGHTEGHSAYVVRHAGETALFTGGSLLFGSVGRTDLVDPARVEEMTRRQYRGVRRLVEGVPAEAEVFPTHGFGSFCSSGGASGADAGTVGDERRSNDALTTDDEDAFVAALVAGLTAYPAYYAHMGPLNAKGPTAADLEPIASVDAAELQRRLHVGEWVVDLRSRTAYAAEHLVGTVGIELGAQFGTYVGWLLPWDTPITLVGESAGQVADAQRQLARIGVERLTGSATGAPADLAGTAGTGTYRRADFTQIAEAPVVLDVRRDDEWTAGHLAGAVNVPLQQLMARTDELPAGQLWVLCQSGYRASIAASLLDRAGRDVVLVDDSFDRAVALGLTTAG